jgi:imidazolonepropionase-like amidohydrolase
MTGSFVLRGAYVLDEEGGFSGPLDTVVVEGRVAEVQRGAAAPAGIPEYDFTGLWLMPGIFDCHTHVTYSATTWGESVQTPLTQWVLEGAQNMREILAAGVTFVRDAVGADPGFRQAVDSGFVPGPRLQVSWNQLSQTGGHSDGFLHAVGIDWAWTPDWPGRPATVVDGVEEMRRTVRQLLRAGVDWIKLCTTGGIVSEGDERDAPYFTEEEVRTAVLEAGRLGRSVMSHAFGGEGLTTAVRAGVRSIEHGLALTEEQAGEMAASGCWLVPTLAAMRDIADWGEGAASGEDNPLSSRGEAIRKALEVGPLIGQAVQIAKAAGIRMAVGSDCIFREQHGGNLRELPLLHQAGLSVEETLLAATAGGAELCGVADHLGRIAPGYTFDAIVLDQDPGDLSIFSQRGGVSGVFKAGEPVLRHERCGDLGPKRQP